MGEGAERGLLRRSGLLFARDGSVLLLQFFLTFGSPFDGFRAPPIQVSCVIAPMALAGVDGPTIVREIGSHRVKSLARDNPPQWCIAEWIDGSRGEIGRNKFVKGGRETAVLKLEPSESEHGEYFLVLGICNKDSGEEALRHGVSLNHENLAAVISVKIEPGLVELALQTLDISG